MFTIRTTISMNKREKKQKLRIKPFYANVEIVLFTLYAVHFTCAPILSLNIMKKQKNELIEFDIIYFPLGFSFFYLFAVAMIVVCVLNVDGFTICFAFVCVLFRKFSHFCLKSPNVRENSWFLMCVFVCVYVCVWCVFVWCIYVYFESEYGNRKCVLVALV